MVGRKWVFKAAQGRPSFLRATCFSPVVVARQTSVVEPIAEDEREVQVENKAVEGGEVKMGVPYGTRIFPGSAMVDVKDAYDLGKPLGSGSFSTVYLATRRGSGEKFACKCIPKTTLTSEEHIEDLKNEISTMKAMAGHPHVTQLVEVFEDAAAVYLVLELAAQGDLFEELDRRGGFPEAEAADVFRQLVSAVASCHDNGVIHRDLKLENVLLADSTMDASSSGSPLHIKLADFGLAVHVRKEETVSGLAGSAFYMAPEIIAGKRYGTEVDMWSLGVILYALLSGELPFGGSRPEDVFRSILRRGKLLTSGKKWWGVSAEARALVQWLLEWEPAKRPTAQQVLATRWLNAPLIPKTEEVIVDKLAPSLASPLPVAAEAEVAVIDEPVAVSRGSSVESVLTSDISPSPSPSHSTFTSSQDEHNRSNMSLDSLPSTPVSPQPTTPMNTDARGRLFRRVPRPPALVLGAAKKSRDDSDRLPVWRFVSGALFSPSKQQQQTQSPSTWQSPQVAYGRNSSKRWKKVHPLVFVNESVFAT